MTTSADLSRPTTSGSSGGVVSYDFRRPIQLSREHARLLQLAFEGFARQAETVVTSSLRSVCQVTLAGLEQRSYAEYVDSLGQLTYLTLFEAEPLPGQCILEIPLRAVMSCVDHMLGGPGSTQQPERPLTEIESGVIRTIVERLLGEMRYSLADVIPIEPVTRATEYSPQFAQVAGAADVMVVVTFDLRIDDEPFGMTLCLPFSGLHPHLVRASAPSPVSDRERDLRARAAGQMRRGLQDVEVDVAVRLRPSPVPPEVLSTLAVGDVLRLSHPAAAPLDVVLGTTVLAHATPGAQGRRLAALIVGQE